jgi:protein TonB
MKNMLVLSFLSIAFAGMAQDSTKTMITTDSSKKKQVDDYNMVFTKTEIEPDFPFGQTAWTRFLSKNLQYPDEAAANNIQGTVIVQFIVDKEGKTSSVEAVSGPERGGLREEAIRIIKKSGRWTPAVQNGRQVKAYKRQAIVFKLD